MSSPSSSSSSSSTHPNVVVGGGGGGGGGGVSSPPRRQAIGSLTVEQMRLELVQLQVHDVRGNRDTLKRRLQAARANYDWARRHLCKKNQADGRDTQQQQQETDDSGDMANTAGALLPSVVCRRYHYFVVIDFEATCEEGQAFVYDNEIIEFPAILLDGLSMETLDEFHEYVRPTLNPRLSDYCTRLTGITQTMVDASDLFPQVLERFERWLASHRMPHPHSVAFITDGPWDLRDFLHKQCGLSGIPRPHYFDRWINLRHLFRNHIAGPTNLEGMLTALGMQFQGRPHSGIDDTRNIVRIAQAMMQRGIDMRINEKMKQNVPVYQVGQARQNAEAREAAKRMEQQQQQGNSHAP